MTSKQLRDSILQAAIQGQLVPQLPSDTPAALLLERIQAERERLIKEKKIRRDKNASVIYRTDEGSYYERNLASGEETCIDDEIPFDIPDSWQWSKIGDVFQHNNGKQLNKGKSSGVLMDYITTSNLYWDGFILEDLKQMPFESNEIDRCQALKGDLLVCEGGDIGRACIWNYDFPIMLQNHIHKLRAYIPICTEYVYYIFYLYNLTGLIGGKGIGIKGYSAKALHNTLIPIPPLEEQERIVARIEELMTLVDHYEESKVALDELESTLPDMLQQSILQAAIQGQLVPQVPSDTPATLLLERIQAERERLIKEKKIRRDKNASVIYRTDEGSYYERNLASGEETCIDDEIPFDIPDSWQWSKIGDVFQHNNGKQLNKGKSSGVLMDYITTSNLYWDGFILEDLKQMPFESNEIDRCQALKGDLLVCEGGDIGRACIWNYDFPIMLQNHIHKLRAYIPICTEYVYYIFYLYNRMGLIGGKGIGIKGYSSNALHNTLIPIPPLEEQERIVARIEELMRYTDRLKSFTTPD